MPETQFFKNFIDTGRWLHRESYICRLKNEKTKSQVVNIFIPLCRNSDFYGVMIDFGWYLVSFSSVEGMEYLCLCGTTKIIHNSRIQLPKPLN